MRVRSASNRAIDACIALNASAAARVSDDPSTGAIAVRSPAPARAAASASARIGRTMRRRNHQAPPSTSTSERASATSTAVPAARPRGTPPSSRAFSQSPSGRRTETRTSRGLRVTAMRTASRSTPATSANRASSPGIRLRRRTIGRPSMRSLTPRRDDARAIRRRPAPSSSARPGTRVATRSSSARRWASRMADLRSEPSMISVTALAITRATVSNSSSCAVSDRGGNRFIPRRRPYPHRRPAGILHPIRSRSAPDAPDPPPPCA